LYGGKTAFREYVKAHPDKFFSALEDSFQTCCHPEFLLNKQYRNEHTKRYAELWDEIYSEIRSYFGNPDKCIEGNNIVMKVDGSVSFELLKKAAEEKNACTSEQLRDLAERGEHPWQQPEFINAHSKRTSERARDLVARGEHLFQQPEFIEKRKKEQEEQARQKKEQKDQARHEALQRKKEHEEHARQRKKEQEGQAPKARGKNKTFDDRMEDLKRSRRRMATPTCLFPRTDPSPNSAKL
jgi:hypothetical protein